MQIETIKTETFTMDYFQFGKGERILVILPGLSVQSVMGLADVVAGAYERLADDFTIYVFDRRKDLPSQYSMQDMAKDTEAAFEVLGMDKISIFGASQGGMLAMEIAIDHPEWVEKLILGSTSARIDPSQYQTIGNWIQLAKEENAEDLYLAFGEAIYPKELFERSHDAFIDAARTVTEDDLNRFIRLAESMEGFDVTTDLEKINCPVLVIGDKDDKVLGTDASDLISQYLSDHPGFELYMYEGYGHAVYDTAPDYRERMLRFLL